MERSQHDRALPDRGCSVCRRFCRVIGDSPGMARSTTGDTWKSFGIRLPEVVLIVLELSRITRWLLPLAGCLLAVTFAADLAGRPMVSIWDHRLGARAGNDEPADERTACAGNAGTAG